MKAVRLVSVLLVILLLAGCGQAEPPRLQEDTAITQLGEGEKSFLFTVTDAEGTQTAYEIHTDKTTVGEALLALDLIAGDKGPYGLYVKTVVGITVDYNKDGKYWAFYQGDTYATSGVDTTEISEGATYGFRVE